MPLTGHDQPLHPERWCRSEGPWNPALAAVLPGPPGSGKLWQHSCTYRTTKCQAKGLQARPVSPTRRKPGSAASPRTGGPDDVRTTRDTCRVITGEIGGGGGAAATHPRAAPRPRPEALAAGRRLEPAAAGPGAARGDLGHRLRQAHPASRPRHFTRAGRKTSRPGPGSTRRPRRR